MSCKLVNFSCREHRYEFLRKLYCFLSTICPTLTPILTQGRQIKQQWGHRIPRVDKIWAPGVENWFCLDHGLQNHLFTFLFVRLAFTEWIRNRPKSNIVHVRNIKSNFQASNSNSTSGQINNGQTDRQTHPITGHGHANRQTTYGHYYYRPSSWALYDANDNYNANELLF